MDEKTWCHPLKVVPKKAVIKLDFLNYNTMGRYMCRMHMHCFTVKAIIAELIIALSIMQ